MVDCDNGMKDPRHATTNQILMLHQGSELQLQNNDIVNAMINFDVIHHIARTTMMTIFLSVILQGATTMVDCNKRAKSRKQ
jgi:hypothetical protein